MNVQLTVDNFNPAALASVTAELRGRGLTIKENWMGDFEPTTPELAKSWKITTPDECLVSQQGKRVKIEAVGKYRRWVLSALVANEILTPPPSYEKGIVWVVLYAFLVVLSALYYGPGLMQTLLIAFLILQGAGYALAHASLRNNQPGWPMVIAYILMAPCLISTFPSSLLNTQLIRQYIRGRHYLRGREYLPDNRQHDPGTPDETLSNQPL